MPVRRQACSGVTFVRIFHPASYCGLLKGSHHRLIFTTLHIARSLFAVVISGEVHNDDTSAANTWMGPGTFWTQPAGEVHITSARPGLGGTAFLEILEGPYLVQPGDQAFDNGERPLNLLRSNMMWMSADEFKWIAADADSPQVALLWGGSEPRCAQWIYAQTAIRL